MITMTNERDNNAIEVTQDEINQVNASVTALNKIHLFMLSETSKGRVLKYKRALNKANRIGDMAPVVKLAIDELADADISLDIADIFANAVRDKINERGAIEESPKTIREMRERKVEEQGHRCATCGDWIDVNNSHLAHILPKKVVGNTLGEVNLQATCARCNRHNATNHDAKEFLIAYKRNHK